MNHFTAATTPRPRKIQIGDLVDLSPTASVYKFHRHPLEVLSYLEDLKNPKLIFHDDKNVPPETVQRYLVSDAREMFDRFGYRTRVCKVVGIVNADEGWLPDKSLLVVFEGS
jgi:hypothetical protein